MRSPRLKVRCRECAKTWHTSNPGPECPRCGGTDIDLAEPSDPRAKTDCAATGGRDRT